MIISTLLQAFISNDVVQTPYLEVGKESSVRPTGGSEEADFLPSGVGSV